MKIDMTCWKDNLEAAEARFNEAVTPREIEAANEQLSRAKVLYNGYFTREKYRKEN